MKKIVAFFKPKRLDVIKECMLEFGYDNVRFSYIKGPTIKEIVWQGKTYVAELLPKAKMEVIVTDSDVEKVVSKVTEIVRRTPASPALGEEAEFALRLKGEDIGSHGARGRWVRMTPAQEEPSVTEEELETIEIRA
ncbi:MAG TPA: P-II family nitrogen regulator [Candidatus Hypogeohydataceae bacterium YC41]